MCGIVGIISKETMGLSSFQTSAFNQMLFVDQLRGMDGTGIFYNNKRYKPSVQLVKGAMTASAFLQTEAFIKADKQIYQQANFVIGHNRAATKGKHTFKNTHPFKVKHITLIHNGTLRTQKELHPDLEVDSHAICHSIAEIGYKKTLEKLNGAFALVWFNSKTGKLHFCRNHERPLFLIECNLCYVIVSEAKLAEWILSRNGIKIKKIVQVPTEKVFSFHIENMGVYTEEEVDYKDWYSSTWGGYGGYLKDKEEQLYKPLKFKKGDVVRFRTGRMIGKEGALGNYIEADIFKNQYINEKKYIDLDYEDKWRIKVIPSKKAPLTSSLRHEYNCAGEIINTSLSSDGKTTFYYVDNIIIIDEESNTVPNKGALVECDSCHEFSRESHVYIQGFLMCPSCCQSTFNSHFG